MLHIYIYIYKFDGGEEAELNIRGCKLENESLIKNTIYIYSKKNIIRLQIKINKIKNVFKLYYQIL